MTAASTPPLDRVIAALRRHGFEVRSASGGLSCRCPAHADSHASLSLGIGEDGRVLLFCHAGCATTDVLAAVGLQLRDLFPAREPWRLAGLGRHGRRNRR